MIVTDVALAAFADEVGESGPVAVEGGRTRWSRGGSLSEGTRLVRAPVGIVVYRPEEMTVHVRAGTTVAELEETLAVRGQRSALPGRGGTIGGALAAGENHPWMLGRGALRATVLQVRYVSAEGRVVAGGGPTVKNVSGYDLPRLMVGALGTLGLIGDAILRTNPRPAASCWLQVDGADPFAVRDALHRPGAVLTDGAVVWVLLEGHPADVGDQRVRLGRLGDVVDVGDPPPLPPHRWSMDPASLRTLDASTTGRFVAAVGTGLMFAEQPPPPRELPAGVAAVHRRMKGNFDPAGRLNPGRDPGDVLMDLGIDAEALNACVQCGLCLSACPTYRVTGDETMSPRGRIALMREVQVGGAPLTAEVERALETCVQCRGCEPACPSGVTYGRLIEQTRATLAGSRQMTPLRQRWALTLLGRPRLLRAATAALAVAQRARLVPRRLGLPRLNLRRPPRPPSSGLDVYLFTGCVMDAWQGDVHDATQRVLEAAGLRVTQTGDGAPCCGALHVHAGLLDVARRHARRVIGALAPDVPVVVDSAGCGAAMKDYGHLLGDRSGERFATRVADVSELLAAHLDRLPAAEPLPTRVGVQDPCHLRHVQRVHMATRAVLAPFVAELIELDDEGLCCGAGGAYSALEPQLAGAIRERKLAAIRRAGVDVVASANPGCAIHLAVAGVPVEHPMTLVDRALDRRATRA